MSDRASSLLDRARRRRTERDEQATADQVARLRRDAMSILPTIRRVLELDVDDIGIDDLRPLTDAWERNLFEFDLQGLRFIAGAYWHGNPGDSSYLAVKVAKRAPRPEWPPPHPQSVSNTRWAPRGYRAIYSLAELADAIEASR